MLMREIISDICRTWMEDLLKQVHSFERVNKEGKLSSHDLESAPGEIREKLRKQFPEYSALICFDTETTGLSSRTDHLTQAAAVKVDLEDGKCSVFNEYVSLPDGIRLSGFISNMTGITADLLHRRGESEAEVLTEFARFFGEGKVLLAAHNIHFDLSFLQAALDHCRFSLRSGEPDVSQANRRIMQEADYLDTLTIVRERKPSPHGLGLALHAYGFDFISSHNALSDSAAALALTVIMMLEKPDLDNYVNRIGINSKYGLRGEEFGRVTYYPQEELPKQH